MKRLKDKVCIITGGASGIGHASVLRFLSEGARVVLADLNEPSGRTATERIAASGNQERIRFFHGDVSEEKDVIQLVRFATKEFGQLDVIFNNAGIGGAFGRLIDTRVEDWDRTLAVLLRSAFLCTKHAASAMIRGGQHGSIVNNAALAGLFGDMAGAAYSAAKAGVINLTKTSAVQLAPHRIRVNSISPGFIMTPLLVREGDQEELAEAVKSFQAWPDLGKPEHVASVATFLASDESQFITGENIIVDGGYAAGGGGLYQSGHPLGRAIAERMQQAGVRHFDYGTTGMSERDANDNGSIR